MLLCVGPPLCSPRPGLPPHETCLGDFITGPIGRRLGLPLDTRTLQQSGKVRNACGAGGQSPSAVLDILRPACYANSTYFSPCQSLKTSSRFPYSLEWVGGKEVQLRKLTPRDFAHLLDSHTVTWMNGTTYSTFGVYFPHSVMAFLPMLNLPLLGRTMARFFIGDQQVSNWDWQFAQIRGHGFNADLVNYILQCLGVSERYGGKSLYSHFHNKQVGGQLLCFEEMMVPNAYFNCENHFVVGNATSDLWPHVRNFFYGMSLIPTGRLWPPVVEIGFIRRTDSRPIKNHEEAVWNIRKLTGLPVTILHFHSTMNLDEQLMAVSRLTVLVGAHGGGMMNTLFLRQGATAVEVLTAGYTVPCYYGGMLTLHGIQYRAFCAPHGPCEHRPSGKGHEYPREGGLVDAQALARVVLAALRDSRV